MTNIVALEKFAPSPGVVRELLLITIDTGIFLFYCKNMRLRVSTITCSLSGRCNTKKKKQFTPLRGQIDIQSGLVTGVATVFEVRVTVFCAFHNIS